MNNQAVVLDVLLDMQDRINNALQKSTCEPIGNIYSEIIKQVISEQKTTPPLNELQKKQLKFLEDTVEYYKTNPRGLDSKGRCCYEEGCAIGRHLATDLCQILDEEGSVMVTEDSVFLVLPPWMKKLGKDFLYRVQQLHDRSCNWTRDDDSDLGNELSKKGVGMVDKIKQKYGLGE